MSTVPSSEQLSRAVEQVLASRPDLEGNAASIAASVRDDNFMWRVSVSATSKVVDALKAATPVSYVAPTELCTFDFVNAEASDIDACDWEKAPPRGIYHAQGGLGSPGVYLIQTADDRVVVLKFLSASVVSDVFASSLCNLLKLRAPSVRPLPNKEFRTLINALRTAPVAVAGTCQELFSGHGRTTLGGVLMEYLPGFELDSPPARTIITPVKPKHRAALRQTLLELGGAVALDLVLNNADRTPFAWRGEGNGGNILISAAKGKRVCLVDQTLCPIPRANKEFDSYMECIRKVVVEAMSATGVGFYTDKMRSFMDGCLTAGNDCGNGAAVTVHDMQFFQRGLLSGIKLLVKSGQKIIATAHARTLKLFHVAFQVELSGDTATVTTAGESTAAVASRSGTILMADELVRRAIAVLDVEFVHAVVNTMAVTLEACGAASETVSSSESAEATKIERNDDYGLSTQETSSSSISARSSSTRKSSRRSSRRSSKATSD